MPDTPQFLAKRLRSEGEKMTAYFAALDDADWEKEVYTEGTTWTVRNVLAHFVTAEQGFIKLFADIVAGGKGAADDFDIDRYNARQQEKAETLSPQELLVQFQDVREKMAAWVEGLTEEELAKVGRHPYLGENTVAEMVKLVYRHNQIHYRDMRKGNE